MIRPLVLASALLASACVAVTARPPRDVVSLPKIPVASVQAGEAPTVVGPTEGVVVYGPALPMHSRRFEIESAALTRAFGRPRTIGAEVVLPEGFRPDENLAIDYHVPDLDEDPVDVAERLATIAGRPRLLLVVLDPRGIQGHHAFVDSVNEGPHGEALVTDLIPVLEQHLFGGSVARRRFLTGVGLGGWTVIRLQIEYSHAFDAAFAFDPEPLDMHSFYGCDLVATARGQENRLAPARRLQGLRGGRLAGRLASFESALGARGDDGKPMPLFRGSDGEFDPDVVAGFVRRGPAEILRERGAALAPKLVGKLHALAHRDDPYGRDASMRSFAAMLDALHVPGVFRTVDGLDFDAAMLGAWNAVLAPAKP